MQNTGKVSSSLRNFSLLRSFLASKVLILWIQQWMTIVLAGAVHSKFVSRQSGSRRTSSSHCNQGAASTGLLDNHCIIDDVIDNLSRWNRETVKSQIAKDYFPPEVIRGWSGTLGQCKRSAQGLLMCWRWHKTTIIGVIASSLLFPSHLQSWSTLSQVKYRRKKMIITYHCNHHHCNTIIITIVGIMIVFILVIIILIIVVRALVNVLTVQVKAIPFLWPVITIGEYVYNYISHQTIKL